MNSFEKEDIEIPFFHLLSDNDKKKYIQLRESIIRSDKRFKKNKRIECLQEALNFICKFTERNDNEYWKRCLVCGFCMIGPKIAINIRQISILTSKCKSSINGALSKMGYKTEPFKSFSKLELLARIPYLQNNFFEQKQWTIRQKIF